MKNSDSFSPHTGVVITGGASGIGLACAELLAERGRAVALWDLDESRCQQLAQEISQRHDVQAIGIGVDVRDVDAIARAAGRTGELLDSIGALVHAAGVSGAAPLDELTEAAWDSVLDVNLKAMPFLVQAFLPQLRANTGSAVVGIASMNARLGNRMIPAYTASKGALSALVQSMADDLASDGIRINSVSPGVIATPMVRDSISDEQQAYMVRRVFLGRMGEPQEIATVVRFLLSDEASFVTAADWLVDGGNVVSQR